jgi:hypothetical protein
MSATTNERVLIGYLCYLNENNKSRRSHNFFRSLESISFLENQPCKVVAFKNNCSEDVSNVIDKQKGIDESISFKENFWDVSVVYASAKLANERGYDYCCYMYDDFVVYDNNFVSDCIQFMDENNDVGCLRIPNYSYENMYRFNSEITPKSVNPDSLRHYNWVSKLPLTWEGPYKINNHTFYKNNWHYTSRPTLWRTEVLLSFFEKRTHVPVMQPFEGYACKKFYETGLKTGVLNGGSMYTFLESERTSSPESRGLNINVNLSKIDLEICVERKKNDL